MATRLERVLYYLRRRIQKNDPKKDAVISEQMLANPELINEAARELGLPASFADFAKGTKLIGGVMEPTYRSVWMCGVLEECEDLLLYPHVRTVRPDIIFPEDALVEHIRTACQFNERQMHEWMSGVTEQQFQLMAKLIAEGTVPLNNCWSAEDILFELSLAAGNAVTDLQRVTYASFDGRKHKPDKEWSVLAEGEYNLLRVHDRACFKLSTKEDGERGGAITYHLAYVHERDSPLEVALEKYRHTITEYHGKDSAQHIMYH